MHARDDRVPLAGKLGRLGLDPVAERVRHHAAAAARGHGVAVEVGGVDLRVDHDEGDATLEPRHVGETSLAVGDLAVLDRPVVLDALDRVVIHGGLRGLLVVAHARVDVAELGLRGVELARAVVAHLRVVLEGHGAVVVEVVVARDHEHRHAGLLQARHLLGKALVARLLALARQVARHEQDARQRVLAGLVVGDHLVDGSLGERLVLAHQAQVARDLALVVLGARALVLGGEVVRVAHHADGEAVHRAGGHLVGGVRRQGQRRERRGDDEGARGGGARRSGADGSPQGPKQTAQTCFSHIAPVFPLARRARQR